MTSTIRIAGIHQRQQHLLAHRHGEALVGDVAVEHFGERAALLAGHDGGDVHGREDALAVEGVRQQRAVADLVADGADVAPEFRVGEAVGEQVETFEDRQAGADEGDELLVEDQELFEIELLLLAADARRERRAARRGA